MHMLHGIINARHTPKLANPADADFVHEVQSFFGSGTSLQELYITPELMTASAWNVLARHAKWARANAHVLRDTHWVGGNPGRGDIYGWAAWTRTGSFVTLRNPTATPKSYVLDLAQALELPVDAARRFQAQSLWTGKKVANRWDADTPHMLRLDPFEVLTIEFKPR